METVRWSALTGKEDVPVQEVEGTYDNPCAALKAIHDRADDFAFKEQLAVTMDELRAKCDHWRAKQMASAPGAPPPEPPPPDPAAQPAPEVEPPTPVAAGDDSTQAQGAPSAPASESVTVASEPAPTSYSALAPKVFAPEPHNIPTEWVLDLLEPPTGALGTDEDWLTRMLRGHPEPAKRSWSHADPPSSNPVRKGDPVDLFSGRFTMEVTDLEVPTPFVPLHLRRCYRSGPPYFGPWGFNWDHNYNQYLRELSDGGIAVWTGRLYETHFAAGEAGWIPEPGLHQRLSSPSPGVYQLVLRGGVSLLFERPSNWNDPQRIPLVEISDRHGNRQLLSYDSLDRPLRVAEHPRGADGPPGRWLQFEYGNCGLLEGLQDHAGRYVRYFHHPEIEHLARVELPAIDGYPKGVCTEYLYADEAEHPAVKHNIVGVTDADGRLYLENQYAGPDQLWAFNRVVGQRVGDDVFEFEYEQLQFVARRPEYANLPAVQTTYRPPDGSLHTYTFNYRGDQLDHRFRLNLDGSARVVVWQREYDDQGNTTLVVDPAGRRTALTYDHDNADPCTRGNLTAITLLPSLSYLENPRVLLQVYYDPQFQLPIRIVDAQQSETGLRYDFDDGLPGATGRLTAVRRPAVTLPTGEVQAGEITVGTNDQGLITFVESALGARHELARWDTGLPRELRLDRYGADVVTSFDYDGRGFLTRITDTFGSATDLTFNAFGLVEHILLPEVDGVPAQLRFRYGADGGPVRRETPRGAYQDAVVAGPDLVDETHRDVLGRATEQIIGANTARPRRVGRCYDHAGNVVHLVDPAGCHTHNTFDERGRLLERAVGDGPDLVTRFTYEIDGRLRRVTFPDGSLRTVEERDAWGRPRHVREQAGALRKLTWSNSDRLLESNLTGDPGDGTQRLLERVRYEYDARDRLVRRHVSAFDENPDQAVEVTTTYHYDADDRLRRVVTPTGEVSWDYDGIPRVTRYTDAVGNTMHVSRHGTSRLIELSQDEVEPTGVRTTTWQFILDERMRLRRIGLPAERAIDLVRDDRDLVIEQREPLGVVRRLRYGLLGEIEHVTVDPDGLAIVTQYQRDAVGRVVGFIDASGAVTTWQRDCLGRPTTVKTPDGGLWQMTYGVGGLIERVLPSGSRQRFDYWPHERRYTIDCLPAAPVLGVPHHEYRYDGLGRLVRAAAGASIVVRRYDSQGRLVREAAGGREVRWHHDDLTGYVDLRYPDGRLERTTLDAAGRPVAVTLLQPGTLGGASGDQLVEITYAGVHRVHTTRYANGVESNRGYDDALRLVTLDLRRGAEQFESYRYGYDARDRRRLVESSGPPALQRLHTFDTGDRLVAVASGFVLAAPPSGPWTQAMHDQRIAAAEVAAAGAADKLDYGLTLADDRTHVGSTTYTHSAGHRLTGVGAEKVAHAVDGARVADGDLHYEIDAFGRVATIRAASTGAIKATYEYDALSRVYKGQLTSTDFQHWFAASDWIHSESAAGVAHQRTMHPGSPVPLLHRDPNGSLTLAGDGLLNSALIFDASGGLVERHRYDPFGLPTRFAPDGQLASLPVPPGAAPLFGGMSWSQPLGLYETPLRLYHPRHGEFLAPDQHGYADSPNPYAFTQHNPIDFADPTGADKQPRYSDQKVEQMWHATWDSYLELSFDTVFHAASWSARLTPQGLVALAFGYDPGAPTEWFTTLSPLKFGPPDDPLLRGAYDEHHFGSTIFFAAIATVGLGVASGPRIAADAPVPSTAGAAHRSMYAYSEGEFVLLQRGGKHVDALEAQGWWSGHTPEIVRGNVTLWEFRSGDIMFDYARFSRHGELEELMEFKWDYSGSIYAPDPKIRAAAAQSIHDQAATQVARSDYLGKPLSWTVPEGQLWYFQQSVGSELSSQIKWITYDLPSAKAALGL